MIPFDIMRNPNSMDPGEMCLRLIIFTCELFVKWKPYIPNKSTINIF